MTNAQIQRLIKELETRKLETTKLASGMLKALQKTAKAVKNPEMTMLFEEAKKDHEREILRMNRFIEELRQKLTS